MLFCHPHLWTGHLEVLSCLSWYRFGLTVTEAGCGQGSGRGWVPLCLLNQRENGQVCPNLRHAAPRGKSIGTTHEST